MASVYYDGNAVDTTSKDQLSGEILNKIVAQEIESKVFGDIFGVFTRKLLDTGKQVEEIEVANLESSNFDPAGTNPLTKADLTVAVLYHKINRQRKIWKQRRTLSHLKMC